MELAWQVLFVNVAGSSRDLDNRSSMNLRGIKDG
jgi:hypothetical protein